MANGNDMQVDKGGVEMSDELKDLMGKVTDPEASVTDRREFLRKLLTVALGAPLAVGALGGLAGCDTYSGVPGGGGGGNGGGDVGALGAEVVKARADLQTLLDELVDGKIDDTLMPLATALARLNAILARFWQALAGASDADIRANVHPDMEQYAAQLDGWSVPINLPGTAPQYSAADFTQASNAARAELAGLPGGEMAAQWVFAAWLFLTNEEAVADDLVGVFAGLADDEDTADNAVAVYETAFGPAPADKGGLCPGGLADFLLLLVFCLFGGMESSVATMPGLLLGNALPAVLMVILFFFMLFA